MPSQYSVVTLFAKPNEIVRVFDETRCRLCLEVDVPAMEPSPAGKTSSNFFEFFSSGLAPHLRCECHLNQQEICRCDVTPTNL